MCREINSSYSHGNILATALVMRTVLNHVPSVFGHDTFAQVVAGVGKSLKDSFNHLENGLRKVADFHIHRKIAANESYPTAAQVEPFKPQFELLLQQVEVQLRLETAPQGSKGYGKTKKSLRTVHLPEGLANELWLWKQECPDSSPGAFIFPNARKRNGATKNGFIRTDNYRARVLKKLGEELGLKKLNFQLLRRTIATLAQTKGNVKDVQGILGHTKADTTANVYMQTMEEGVKLTLDAIYAELTGAPRLAAVV